MKLITALLLAISLNANAYCVKPTPLQAAVGDTVTTAVALSNGDIELNPLGFGGSLALKGFLLLYGNDLVEGETKKSVERFESSIWSLGTISNTLTILGAPFMLALSGGLVAGYVVLTSECGE